MFLQHPFKEESAFLWQKSSILSSWVCLTVHTIDCIAKPQMTCEQMYTAVTNVETMLSEAEQKFSLHKGVIVDLTNGWAGWKTVFVVQRRWLSPKAVVVSFSCKQAANRLLRKVVLFDLYNSSWTYAGNSEHKAITFPELHSSNKHHIQI